MYELVDPRGRVTDRSRALTPRPNAIPDPLVVGFIVNEPNRSAGPDFTAYSIVIEEELRRRYANVQIVRDWKPVLSRPADEAMLEKFRHCRGVVSGLAK